MKKNFPLGLSRKTDPEETQCRADLHNVNSSPALCPNWGFRSKPMTAGSPAPQQQQQRLKSDSVPLGVSTVVVIADATSRTRVRLM